MTPPERYGLHGPYLEIIREVRLTGRLRLAEPDVGEFEDAVEDIVGVDVTTGQVIELTEGERQEAAARLHEHYLEEAYEADSERAEGAARWRND